VSAPISNVRPKPDKVLTLIADYATKTPIRSAEAYETARYCLMDTLGCGLEALEYPACTKLLGPIDPGTVTPQGAKVPGTKFQLDPVQAAFNIGAMIRWLDFNDTWLAAEWGHPSDNLGGILATADWLSRNEKPLLMRDVLTAMIKAHEIQGVLALENSFNRVGLDHVVLVKVASTAVVAHMLGCTYDQVVNAVSQAWVDGQSLRTYRHAPNTGSRKSWAAGDATSRAVRLALSRPELFLVQLRAMVRASAYGSLRIMIPMIASVHELRAVRKLLDQAIREVDEAGHKRAEHIPLGIMVEVPAAAIMADELSVIAEFMSIGTNDLVQYALAVDRTSRMLAHLGSPFDPAILRLIRRVVEVGHNRGRSVSICGAMASNPIAAVVLLGMGIRELSMEASAIAEVKEALGRVTLAEAEAMVQSTLTMVTAEEIESAAMAAFGARFADLLEAE